MRTLEVTETVAIERSAEIVRAQFGDVAHHQNTGVHHGVRFELLDDDGRRCRYRQTTRVGPIRLQQHLTLVRETGGPLVNTVTAGPLAGGTITFHVRPDGPSRSRVTAIVEAELRGIQAIAAPMLRSQLAKDLRAALAEDKDDLEHGRYMPAPVG